MKSTVLATNPPCAELHLHLEGTLEAELIFELAERNGITLPYRNVDELRARYEFDDLQSFLDLYYDNMSILTTRQDFIDLTRAYLTRAQQAGVRHAEVFFDPQAHTARGVPLALSMGGIVEALATSERDFDISTGLIACFLRDRSSEEAIQILQEILDSGLPLLGVGLDSAEVGHPPSKFVEVFALARAHGLVCVAHAGEEGPPSYIWQALDLLQVSRVDHGIRCLEDDALVDRLVAEQIPLTVCPLSNVRLRAVEALAEHRLPEMLRRGLLVTVNSDDPAYFGGYVDDNFLELINDCGLTRRDIATLAANSVKASHLTPERRSMLLGEIAVWSAA